VLDAIVSIHLEQIQWLTAILTCSGARHPIQRLSEDHHLQRNYYIYSI